MDPMKMDQLDFSERLEHMYDEPELKIGVEALAWKQIPEPLGELMRAYYLKRMKQSALAQIFRCTQSSISTALTKGVKMLKWLHASPPEPPGFWGTVYEVTEEKKGHEYAENVVAIIQAYMRSHSQSQAGYEMSVTQHLVLQRLDRTIDLLNRSEMVPEALFLEYHRKVPWGLGTAYREKICAKNNRVRCYAKEIEKIYVKKSIKKPHPAQKVRKPDGEV